MHNDREVTEQRLARVLNERIRPAVHARSVRLQVEIWNVPGEPVPVAGARLRPGPVSGAAVGPAWSTSWFRVSGRRPGGLGRATAPVEVVLDLGFSAGIPGFQAEGSVYRPDGDRRQGARPAQRLRAGDRTGRTRCERSSAVEAAANPRCAVAATAPSGPRRSATRATAGRTTRSTASARADLAVLDGTVWRARSRTSRCCSGLMRELPPTPPRRRADPARARAPLDVVDLQDVAGTAAAAPRRAAPTCSPRPRTPARTGSRAVGHAHIDSAWLWPLRETVRKCARTFSNVTRAHGRRPGVRVRLLVRRSSTPGSRSTTRRCTTRIRRGSTTGQLRAGRRHVGRVRHQHARRRGAGPAVRRTASGSSSRSSASRPRRSGCRTPSATPRRCPRSAAAGRRRGGSSPRRCRGTRPTSSRTTPSGGRASTAPGSSPTSRRSTPTTASCRGAELAHAVRNFARQGPAPTTSLVPFGYGDGGGGPTREMLGAAPTGSPTWRARRASSIEPPASFFARGRGRSTPDAPVWSGELYLEFHRGTLHQPGSRPSRATAAASTCCARPSCGAPTAAVRTGTAYPYDDAGPAVEDACCCTSSTTSCPGSSIAWVHREARGRVRGGGRASWRQLDRGRRSPGRRPGWPDAARPQRRAAAAEARRSGRRLRPARCAR